MQVYGIYYIILPKPGTEGFVGYTGLFSMINETSAFYAIAAPAFFRRKRWFLLPVVIVGLFLAHSYQGVVAFAVISVIAAYRLFKSHRLMVIFATYAVTISVCVFFTAIKPFNFDVYRDSRLSIWESSIKVAMVKPLAGWGFGQYSQVIPFLTAFKVLSPSEKVALFNGVRDKQALNEAVYTVSGGDRGWFENDEQKTTQYREAHNEYVEFLFTGGIIGLVLLIGALVHALVRARRHTDVIPFCGLLAACITSFFGFGWHIMPIALLTVLYLGLIKSGGEECLNPL
jgi:O-antigen ligase